VEAVGWTEDVSFAEAVETEVAEAVETKVAEAVETEVVETKVAEAVETKVAEDLFSHDEISLDGSETFPSMLLSLDLSSVI
jgi:hypothetical protein